uniref:EOG090X020Z n=1 Tax=Ceriodaphnia reticulata TaxID=302197 RepID=A0A4Y7LWN2_9CRUS|nr:EOG090X020Z [Ceriodaphnia reticulata]SVE72796.1 EOG090X020Z [Ceriodaphnia reticulata]
MELWDASLAEEESRGLTIMETSEDSSISDQAEPHQDMQKVNNNAEQPSTNEPSNNMCETMLSATLIDPEIEEDNIDGNEEEGEKKSKTAGGFTGRGVTLQMLLEDNILLPKEGAMSLEYMGQKFNGDLLADGKIFSAEVQEVFSSPKPEVEPEIKANDNDRQIIKHETLGNRTSIEDPNLLIETISFAAVGKLQPFLISLSTAALVVMDVHCSLTHSEVVGYLAGMWDMNTNTLTIKQAFPCLSRLADGKRGQATEVKISQSIESSGLSLIGWYHSHPSSPPTPTVQDIDSQLEYQLKLKGTGEQGYRPCVGMISSPFHRITSSDSNGQGASSSHITCFWVSPPAESRPLELGRPMAMQYNVVYDNSIKDDVVPKLVAYLYFYQYSSLIFYTKDWRDDRSKSIEKKKGTKAHKSPSRAEWDYLWKILGANFDWSNRFIVRRWQFERRAVNQRWAIFLFDTT